jgi:tetratricopeptide (TPR) repeat protein
VAVEEFKSALAVDPDHLAHNVNLHLGLCKVLVRLGRGKDALNSCSEALKIDEELIDALVQVLYNFKHHCACFIFYKYFSGPWSPSKKILHLSKSYWSWIEKYVIIITHNYLS